MKDTAYIVVNSKGISRLTRKQAPKLAQGEYAVILHLTVPDHVFKPRPVAAVTLDVKVEQLISPAVEVEQIEPIPQEPRTPIDEDPDFKLGLSEG